MFGYQRTNQPTIATSSADDEAARVARRGHERGDRWKQGEAHE